MDFEWSREQVELREQAREIAASAVARFGRQNDSWINGYSKEFAQEMAALGWIGLTWPTEHGGQGRPPVDRLIIGEELIAAGAPIAAMWFADRQMGPSLIAYGRPDQQAAYLPGMLSGESTWCIGMSEPNAGSDLAGLTTQAVRDGDEWVINGQKIWTSLADHADYIWLACRTNPDPKAPPHKSLSIIIVPTNTPGFSFTPIHALGENNVHATYYDNVRVPYSNLVGKEGEGWKLITSQLNHERVALCAVGPLRKIFEDTVAWARETPAGDGRTLLDVPWVQQNLAKVHAKLEVLELLNCRQAFHIASDTLSPADASAIKVFGSEFYVEGSRLLMEVHDAAGCLHHSSQGAVIRGRLEKFYKMSLVLTFGGGTNEVQRDLIAGFGLRLPTLGR